MTPNRRTYAVALAVMTVVAVYGSLVPFTYQPIPLDVALEQFADIALLRLDVYSRADFVANVLLFVPLGFLAMAALRTDRVGEGGALAPVAAVTIAATALSVSIEFVQLQFPPRTVSLNDVMAETAGAVCGVALWCLAGEWMTRRLRALMGVGDRPGFLVRLLAAYAAVFAVSQVLPLDLTISPGELAAKYREGRVLIVPFSHQYGSAFDAAFDLGADVALHVPLGLLAALGALPRGRRRAWPQALGLGLAAIVAIEIAQLFVFTRVADSTDVVIGCAGMAIGIALSSLAGGRSQPAAGGSARWLFAGGAVAWAAVLVAYHWYPFDFTVTGEVLRDRLPLLTAAPFTHYYWGSEFHAFTELVRKLLMGALLGVLLDRSLSHGRGLTACRWTKYAVVVACLGFFTLIESGQIFLIERIPDLTDAAIATAGSACGMAVVRRALALAPAESEEQYV